RGGKLRHLASTDSSALVLFSGGQDSTTCLAWALERYARVETIGFDYGQRHRIELDCRNTVLQRLRTEFPRWAERLGPDTVVPLDVIRHVRDNARTRGGERAIGTNRPR